MSELPSIPPFDLPPAYLRRRWAGMAAVEENPLVRLAAWRGARRRFAGLWIVQGAAIGGAAVSLIHTNLIWLVPLGLLLYFMLAGSWSRHRTLTLLFGGSAPDYLQGLYLAPLWMPELVLGRIWQALSLRRLAAMAVAGTVVAVYYAWLAWRVRSWHFFLVCEGLLAATGLVWLQVADLFALHWHYLRVKAIWYNRRSNFFRRVGHVFDVGCMGCLMALIGGMAFIVCAAVLMSSLAVTEAAGAGQAGRDEVYVRALPLLLLLMSLLMWYVGNFTRRAELMLLCQGFYFNILTIEATGERPGLNPYMHWLGWRD